MELGGLRQLLGVVVRNITGRGTRCRARRKNWEAEYWAQYSGWGLHSAGSYEPEMSELQTKCWEAG
jgi:hypothetical protein